MKKIFFLADSNSIHTAKWVDYFIEKKYDVHLATFATKNCTKSKKIYFLANKASKNKGCNIYYLGYIYKLASLFKKIEPDYINAHFSYSMGLVALIAMKISKIKSEFSVVCHGTDILIPPYEIITSKINKYVLKNSDKIFAVSHQIKDKIVELNGVSCLNKIFVGQYGINVNLNQVDKDIDILSNRMYQSNSQIDLLLEYLDNFCNDEMKVVFVLSNISESSLNEIKNKYPKIIFYKQVDYNKMLELISRSKIYISATKSDGTSLSLLEAMYLGCIPLISNIISNRSWVLDGVNGYLFDSKDEFLNKLNFILYNYRNLCLPIININVKLINKHGKYKKQMKKIEEFMLEEKNNYE